MTFEAQSDPLWRRLRDFPLDEPGARRPFTRRLAEERGWSAAFARRAVAEYRRFLYLGARAGHAVSPSPAVDEVWHLHLTYTRSYWDALCGEVLGRPFHHEPSRGGAEEARKHARMYAETLASYRRLFGEAPPADVWPAAGAPRVGRMPPARGLGVGAAALAALLLAAACARDLGGEEAIVIGGGLLVLAIAAGAGTLLRAARRRGEGDAPPLDGGGYGGVPYVGAVDGSGNSPGGAIREPGDEAAFPPPPAASAPEQLSPCGPELEPGMAECPPSDGGGSDWGAGGDSGGDSGGGNGGGGDGGGCGGGCGGGN